MLSLFIKVIYNNPRESPLIAFKPHQRAKKVVSNSPRLVDFAIGLVIFVLNLSGQVLFWGEFKLQKDCNQYC